MKHLTTLLLAISLSTSVFSQNYTFEAGIQGGPSISHIRYLNGVTSAFKVIPAFSGGIFLQYNFNKTFALRMDPAFEQKGYKYKETTSMGVHYNSRGNFNYITIPILLRASIGNKIKYFVNAGPYMGFLLSQKTISSDVFNDDTKIRTNNTSYYKTIDVGLTAGIGISIPIKERFAVSVEARNNIGFLNIAKSSTSNDKTFSANLLIGFAYKFGAK